MFSHHLISVFLFREWVSYLLIHSSNIYQCLVCVSPIICHDREMSKPSVPSKHLSLREYLWPGGWRCTRSSVFSVQTLSCVASASSNSMCMNSHPSWPWYFPLTLKSLCYRYKGFSSRKTAWRRSGPHPENWWVNSPGWKVWGAAVEAEALPPNRTTGCASPWLLLFLCLFSVPKALLFPSSQG